MGDGGGGVCVHACLYVFVCMHFFVCVCACARMHACVWEYVCLVLVWICVCKVHVEFIWLYNM